MRRLPLTPLMLGALASTSACGARREGVVVDVYVAASLAKVMAEVETDFEAANPGTDVRVVAGGSQILATQIAEGAPAELLVTADATSMQAVARTGLVNDRAPLARNRIVLVARRDLAIPVDGLEDLARPGLRVVLASPDVPIGRYTREVLDAASAAEGVAANVVSLEADVLAVLAKVESGEADAALVYATDVAARVQQADATIEVIPIADALQPAIMLEIGLVHSGDTAASAQAQRLRDYLLSGPGRTKLLERGFEAP